MRSVFVFKISLTSWSVGYVLSTFRFIVSYIEQRLFRAFRISFQYINTNEIMCQNNSLREDHLEIGFYP